MAGNKRVDLLVEALALVKASIPEAKLLLVGDCDSSDAYRQITRKAQARAAELGVAGDVAFTGRVEEVAPYFRTADVYVTASLHEGFGVPLIEAMASGLPVVAARSSAMPWVIGEAGRLCEPLDPRDLAMQVLGVLQNEELRADLIRRGLERAHEFSLERYEAGLSSILSELAAPGPTATDPRPLASAPIESSPVRRVRPSVTLAEEIYALDQQSDVAIRGYSIRSGLPLVGPLVAWVRRNLTSHLREPYLDPIIERQVAFNQRVVRSLERLDEIWLEALEQKTKGLAGRIVALESGLPGDAGNVSAAKEDHGESKTSEGDIGSRPGLTPDRAQCVEGKLAAKDAGEPLGTARDTIEMPRQEPGTAATPADDLAGVIEVRDPEIDAESIMRTIRANIRKRRAQAEAQGLDYEAFVEGLYAADISSRFDRQLYLDLRRLSLGYNKVTVGISLTDNRLPLVGRLVQRVRSALHYLVLYYVKYDGKPADGIQREYGHRPHGSGQESGKGL